MEYQFRSALNGFNRSDVVTYLQNLTEAQKNERLTLQTELDRARAELAAMKEKCVRMEALVRVGATDPAQSPQEQPASVQQQELEAYRRAEAAERTAAARAEELERAAKARIEAQERESAARTAQREAEVNARLAEKEAALERLLCGAADRIGGADGDLQAMAVSVQDEVAALSQKLAVLTAALAETSAELKKLKA